jgi:hypothetical protein
MLFSVGFFVDKLRARMRIDFALERGALVVAFVQALNERTKLLIRAGVLEV